MLSRWFLTIDDIDLLERERERDGGFVGENVSTRNDEIHQKRRILLPGDDGIG